MVEHDLAKVGAAGSSPVSRSGFLKDSGEPRAACAAKLKIFDFYSFPRILATETKSQILTVAEFESRFSLKLLSQGRYQSGQLGQTVNLLAHAFVGSNPALPTFVLRSICLVEHPG